MVDIPGMPYYEVSFAADGTLVSDGGLSAGNTAGLTNLFVFSHGWNNSVGSAHRLYEGMFGLLAGLLGDNRSGCAAVGVVWPSLLFPEDDPHTPSAPSTGAQLATALAPAFPGKEAALASLGTMLDEQPQDAGQLRAFHATAAGLVTTPALAAEDEGPEAIRAAVATGQTSAVFGHAAAMTKDSAAPGAGGSGQGLGNPFTMLWSGAREVLRSMSYYEMKNRAGVVGRKGLGPLIGRLAADNPALRVHLVGHSFGARLVSYALSGLPDTAVGAASPVKSIALIQGAFSHFAFADPTPCKAVSAGALAGAVGRVGGPLIATFTSADRAVGWWYPTYQWGGMGHDGFQQSPAAETVELKPAGETYAFQDGSFYLLDANKIIRADQSPVSGAHSDIVHPEVAWAILSAAAV
jgi:pimeloyl-ACP methyl ester carboxylesterase